MKHSLKFSPRRIAGAVLSVFVLLLLALPSATFHSVEYGVTSVSPNGAAGGYIIPASCGSPHAGDLCTAPSFSATSAGGQGSSISVVLGNTATLSWSAGDGASSCDGTNFSTGGAPSGSALVAPTANMVYAVSCSNGGSSSVLVTVINPVLSIAASHTRVHSGDTTTIIWSAMGVNSCAVSGPGAFWTGTSGSMTTPPITAESVYTLTCQTDGGPVSATTTVALTASFEEF